MRPYGGLFTSLLGHTAFIIALGLFAQKAVALVHLHEPPGVVDLLLAAVYAALSAIAVDRGRRRAVSRWPAETEEAGVQNLVLQTWVVGSYVFVAAFVAAIFRVNLEGLLVGGAVTGVVLGLAAQSALGNVIAGMTLVFFRPYVPGQWVTIRSPGGVDMSGRVRDLGLFYTVLDDGEGLRVIPNSAAVTSFIAKSREEDEHVFLATLPRRIPPETVRARAERILACHVAVRVTGVGTESYSAWVSLPAAKVSLWSEVLESLLTE